MITKCWLGLTGVCFADSGNLGTFLLSGLTSQSFWWVRLPPTNWTTVSPLAGSPLGGAIFFPLDKPLLPLVDRSPDTVVLSPLDGTASPPLGGVVTSSVFPSPDRIVVSLLDGLLSSPLDGPVFPLVEVLIVTLVDGPVFPLVVGSA